MQINLDRLKTLATQILQREGCGDMAEVSILLTDNKEIAKLNENYRGVKGPTDVLSFSLNEGTDCIDPGSFTTLGDVIISLDYAQNQAIEYGNLFEKELDFLLIHGLLHLIGYDHEKECDAIVMFKRQEALLEEFSK